MADRMQDDAMQRYRQMYSKAQPEKSHDSRTAPLEKIEEKTEQKESLHNDNQQSKHKNDSILDVFMKDKEKSLIILLIVILLSEKADTTLVLALMYLVI